MDRDQYWTYQRLVQEFEKTDQATLDLFRNVPSGVRALNRYKQIVEQDQNYFEMRDELAHAMEGKPGWCQFVQYDQRNRHGPRRLFYYHKSSKTFQWQNPTLLRKEIFGFSAPDGSNRGPINQLPRGWVSRIVQRFDPATQAPIQSATVYFNTRTQMSTYSDPRAYLSKVDMLIRWNATNAQMFKQHLFLPRKPDDPMDEARMKLKPGGKIDRKSFVYPEDWFKPIEAIVAQFAHWSTEELHPHYMKTLIEGGEIAQDLTGVTRAAILKMAEHFFDKFVHLFDERGYGAFDIAPWTVSKHKHPPHTDHSKGTLPLYYAFGRFLGWVLFLNRPNVHGFQLCVDVGTTVTYPLTGTDQLPLDMLERIYEGMSEWVNDPYLNLEKHKEFPYRVPVIDDDDDDPVGFERRVRLLYTGYSNMTSFTFRYEFLEPNKKGPSGLTIVEKLKDYEILKDLDIAQGESVDTIPLAQIEEHYHKSTDLDQKWITKDCFGRQANAIKNGFKDVIPLEWVRTLFIFCIIIYTQFGFVHSQNWTENATKNEHNATEWTLTERNDGNWIKWTLLSIFTLATVVVVIMVALYLYGDDLSEEDSTVHDKKKKRKHRVHKTKKRGSPHGSGSPRERTRRRSPQGQNERRQNKKSRTSRIPRNSVILNNRFNSKYRTQSRINSGLRKLGELLGFKQMLVVEKHGKVRLAVESRNRAIADENATRLLYRDLGKSPQKESQATTSPPISTPRELESTTGTPSTSPTTPRTDADVAIPESTTASPSTDVHTTNPTALPLAEEEAEPEAVQTKTENSEEQKRAAGKSFIKK